MAAWLDSSRIALFESRPTLSEGDTCHQGKLMQGRSGSHSLLGAGWAHKRVDEVADSVRRERSFGRHRIRGLIRIVRTSLDIPRSGKALFHLLERGWKTGPRLNNTKEAACAGCWRPSIASLLRRSQVLAESINEGEQDHQRQREYIEQA